MATLGEKIVRINFNATGDDRINNAKKEFAQLIDDAGVLAESKWKVIQGTEEVADIIDMERDNQVMTDLYRKLVLILEDASGLFVKLITAP